MKQTAVEWLGNEIDNELKVIDNLYGKEIIGRKIAFAFVKRILIKAKEMEKEQMNHIVDTNKMVSDKVLFEQATVAMEEHYGYDCETEIDAYFRGAKWMQKQFKQQD